MGEEPEITVKDWKADAVPQPLFTVYVMSVVPADTAVTNPVALTVATVVFVLLHVPPALPVVVKLEVDPADRGDVPVTVPAFGLAFTVTNACIGGPVQAVLPLAKIGIIVKVTVTAAAVVFVSVPLMLPLPFAAIPVTEAVLSLIHT